MNPGDFIVKIEAELIARYKDFHHILILMNGKFSNVLIVEIKD